MSLISLVKRRLEQSSGVYIPNHFLITLDKETPFITGPDDALEHDRQHLHVFVHEYWHYWHNVSTFSGFKSFAFTQHILKLFGDTLLTQRDGTSEGSGADPTTRNQIKALLKLQFDIDGDPSPDASWDHDFDLDFEVTGVGELDEPELLDGLEAPNPLVELDVEVNWPDGRTETGRMLFGACAIEESVAYLIEEQVRKEITSAPESPPPAFPYRVVERVLEFELGKADTTPFLAAAIGTLALLSTHPGPVLVTLARALRDLLATELSPEDALEQLCNTHKSHIDTVAKVVSTDLPELLAMHTGRGLSERAIQHFAKVFRQALEARSEHPLVDLKPFFPTADESLLGYFQQKFPSCDILQEKAGDELMVGRDALLSVDPTEPDDRGFRPTDFMRSLQAQQEFVLAHLDIHNARFRPSKDVESTCPYFTVCTLDLRTNNAEICRTQPWRSYVDAAPGCWYATAVAATLGKVDVHGKTREGR